MFYCEITDKDGNIAKTEIVKAEKLNNGLFLSNNESHIYDEKEEGKYIVSRNEIINNAVVTEYELKYTFDNINTIETSDLMILRFTAVASKSNAHIEVKINENEYVGKFPLNTELTEYYLSISNLESLKYLSVYLKTEKQRIDIHDIEILNYNDTPVQNLKTGLYNIEKKSTTIFYEKDAIISEPATDLIDDDEYLYTISNGTLNIYTYNNIGELSLTGSLDGLGNTREMAFSEDKKHLIINSRENGTYFVNITDKANPIKISHYTTLEFATGLYVYENYAFICSRYNGLEIIDISDIENPKFVSQVYKYNEEYYDCSVYNGYLYVSAWAQMKVEIYSLENISNPEHISTILIDGEVGDIVVRDNILYIATGYHSRNSYTYNSSPGYGMGNGMEIYDVSNPESPIWLSTSKIDGRYRNSDFDHWKIKIDGKYVYFTNIYNGIYIYDVTDLKAPKRIDHLYIYIDKTSENYKKINQGTFILPYDSVDHSQGAVSGMALINGRLYFSDLKTGIYVYDNIKDIGNELNDDSTYNITLPEEINNEIAVDGYEVKQYNNGFSIFAIDENEEYIYVASGDGGIVILDKDLNEINSISTKGAVRDIIIKEDILLSAESENGLSIYKIKNEKLEFVSNYNTNKYNTCFSQIETCTNSNYVMVQAGVNKLIILDVSDINLPKLVIEKTTGSMYYGNLMTSDGNNETLWYYDNSGIYAYTENNNGDLEVLYEYKKNFISELNGFCYLKDKILILKNNGYIIFDKSMINDDISEIETIKLTSGEYLRGKPIVKNDTMVVTDAFTKEISIVDISNVEQPILKTRISVYGSPDIALVEDDYIIIPLRNGGLIKLIKK